MGDTYGNDTSIIESLTSKCVPQVARSAHGRTGDACLLTSNKLTIIQHKLFKPSSVLCQISLFVYNRDKNNPILPCY